MLYGSSPTKIRSGTVRKPDFRPVSIVAQHKEVKRNGDVDDDADDDAGDDDGVMMATWSDDDDDDAHDTEGPDNREAQSVCYRNRAQHYETSGACIALLIVPS